MPQSSWYISMPSSRRSVSASLQSSPAAAWAPEDSSIRTKSPEYIDVGKRPSR